MKYKVYVVSLPFSPKREKVSANLNHEKINFEWIDGVIVTNMEDIPYEERSELEAYGIPRLLNDPCYVCRAIGCKRAMQNAIKAAESATEDWVVILQDDTNVIENFDQRFQEIMNHIPSDCGVFMLNFAGGGAKETPVFNDSNGLRQIKGDVRRMAGFAVRPVFASILHDEIAQYGGEEDKIWKILFEKGHLVLATEPQLVHCVVPGSDIICGIPELWSF